jgi:hypothetical protein
VMVRDRDTLKVVLLTIGAIIGLECVLGLAEAFTDLRWPVSRLSWNAHLFGRENDLEILLQDHKARDYILGSPTGFHWNPNHFATLLAFAFPFFLWLRPRSLALLSGIVFLVLVGAAGARLAWLSIMLMLVLMIIFRPRHSVVPAIVLGMILMGASMSAYLKVTSVKVKEFALLTRQVTGVPLFGSAGDGPDPEETSASEGQRRHAMELCFQSLVDTKGLGLGGGGSRQYLLKNWDRPLKPISDPHNWWLEVLCEAGIPYTLLYILVWGGIWVRVVIRSRREIDPMMRRLCASMSVALIGCVPAGVSPSSMVYFLPLYGLWALGVLLAYPAALQQLDGVQGPGQGMDRTHPTRFMGHRLMSSPGP